MNNLPPPIVEELAQAQVKLQKCLALFKQLQNVMDHCAQGCAKTIPEPAQQDTHADDRVVDAFAAAMKAKLAQQRAKGYGDWQDKDKCPEGRLQKLLADHIPKGDPVDVANFAMFLWHRGESTAIPLEPEQVFTPSHLGRNDPMYETAVQIVQSHKHASISLVQRHLCIRFNRAASIIEAMVGSVVSMPDETGVYPLIQTGK